MNPRIAAAAMCLAVFGSVVLSLGYCNTVAVAPDDSGPANSRPAAMQPMVEETATTDSILPLPTVADLPANLSADERANSIDWLAMQGFIDECMEDAGFPEYTYVAYWQPGFTPGATLAWLEPLTSAEREAARLAEYGNAGGGADYHWKDAGCAGYGTHMIGADDKN